ncbi:uncharacterized protein [Pocillopora verrucosa]|uniref:uncharacterized protein n=1 Tax=Pocillopora verrucosa TaxID=203993 RepID=UPI003340F8F5
MNLCLQAGRLDMMETSEDNSSSNMYLYEFLCGSEIYVELLKLPEKESRVDSMSKSRTGYWSMKEWFQILSKSGIKLMECNLDKKFTLVANSCLQ